MSNFEKNVFINCQFDKQYFVLLRPLLFTIIYLDLTPRIALEAFDSDIPRFNKIHKLIAASKYSIHDLSRIRAKKVNEYFRLNMPFELGLDIGSKIFGTSKLNKKRCLILGRDLYKFKIALSDLSNSDIKYHSEEPAKLVLAVRDWFAENDFNNIPSARKIWSEFNKFMEATYIERRKNGFSKKEIYNMPIKEYIYCIRKWKAKN